jgi:hypothetical protein
VAETSEAHVPHAPSSQKPALPALGPPHRQISSTRLQLYPPPLRITTEQTSDPREPPRSFPHEPGAATGGPQLGMPAAAAGSSTGGEAPRRKRRRRVRDRWSERDETAETGRGREGRRSSCRGIISLKNEMFLFCHPQAHMAPYPNTVTGVQVSRGLCRLLEHVPN